MFRWVDTGTSTRAMTLPSGSMRAYRNTYRLPTNELLYVDDLLVVGTFFELM